MGANGPVVKQRGRRPGPVRMRRFVVTLSLHPVLDAELIAALEHTPKGGRARLIREWLRSGPVPGRETADTADVPDL
ncbi:MAG: hypothetical protein N2556_03835, partial [Anaerolineae bacterium]|nr:hypothetical protein [Anaerolineae bacterium]